MPVVDTVKESDTEQAKEMAKALYIAAQIIESFAETNDEMEGEDVADAATHDEVAEDMETAMDVCKQLSAAITIEVMRDGGTVEAADVEEADGLAVDDGLDDADGRGFY